jgi:hypothetical protein
LWVVLPEKKNKRIRKRNLTALAGESKGIAGLGVSAAAGAMAAAHLPHPTPSATPPSSSLSRFSLSPLEPRRSRNPLPPISPPPHATFASQSARFHLLHTRSALEPPCYHVISTDLSQHHRAIVVRVKTLEIADFGWHFDPLGARFSKS